MDRELSDCQMEGAETKEKGNDPRLRYEDN